MFVTTIASKYMIIIHEQILLFNYKKTLIKFPRKLTLLFMICIFKNYLYLYNDRNQVLSFYIISTPRGK